MKRSGPLWLVLLSLVFAIAAARPATGLRAEDDEADATIHDLQTRVASLETQVTADGDAAAETPVPRDRAPAGTAIAEDLELLYYYFEADDTGAVYLFGEVRNPTDRPVDAPTMWFALLDADGTNVGRMAANPLYFVIGPGATMPFDYINFDALEIGGWQREELTVCRPYGREMSNNDPAGLQLRDVHEVVKTGEMFRVTGVVFNARSTPAEHVVVTAAIYDNDGRYSGHIRHYINQAIPPGESHEFAVDQGVTSFSTFIPMEFSGDDYSYELLVGIHQGRTSGCGG